MKLTHFYEDFETFMKILNIYEESYDDERLSKLKKHSTQYYERK